jgi:hypothetical protein
MRDTCPIPLTPSAPRSAEVADGVVTAVGDDLVTARPLGRTPTAGPSVISADSSSFWPAGRAVETPSSPECPWDRPIGALVLAAFAPVVLQVPPLLAATVAAAGLVTVAVAGATLAKPLGRIVIGAGPPTAVTQGGRPQAGA